MNSAPLPQKPFVLAGVLLAVAKVALDYAVSAAFGQTWSPLYYVSPVDAPLFHPGDNLRYYAALWASAIPFLAVGMWLSARRLRDAGAPAWMVLLFVVPFANLLFFLALSVLPTASQTTADAVAGTDATPAPPPSPDGPPRMSAGAALALSTLAGATITLGSLGASVGLLGNYGAPLFIGAPLFSGFATTMLFDQLHGLTRRYAVFHDAYQYLEHRYGLHPLTAITSHPERRPGAAHLSELNAQLSEHDVRCLFSEPQFDSRLIARLSEGRDVRHSVLDPLGSHLVPGPHAYDELMHQLAAGFSRCLGEDK